MIYFTSIFIPLALLIPNIFFFKLKPINIPEEKNKHSKSKQILEIFERVGQIGIFVIPLFYKINISNIGDKISLKIMVLSLLIYYGCWLRFFVNKRDYALLFKPLWMIPIPMAIMPVIYMFFASSMLDSYLLLIATLIFSIGHIPVSYNNYKDTIIK